MIDYNEDKIKEILKWDWLIENGYSDESDLESIEVIDTGIGLVVQAVQKSNLEN